MVEDHLPSAQSMHASDEVPWKVKPYVPILHWVQTVVRLEVVKVPGGQTTQLREPAELYFPGTQSRQTSEEVPLKVRLDVPAGHRLQNVAPEISLYLPAAQPMHADVDVVYLPI
jgi:hypothetical protein